MLADPFLAFVSRVLWHETMPTVDIGKFGVYWVLSHAIRLAPSGVGGPIKLAVLRRVQGKWVADEIDDFQEGEQYVAELEQHIGKFARSTVDEAVAIQLPVPPSTA